MSALAIPEWLPIDQHAAYLEGWDVFDCAGSANAPWQVQKDDAESDWDDDADVWLLIRDSAVVHHRRAMTFLAHHAPEEYELIRAYDPDKEGARG